MDTDQIIQRAHIAEALLNNSLLNECFEKVLDDCAKQWLATKREAQIDVQTREELHAKANAVAELRGQLHAWLNDAVVEVANLERAEKRRGANP